MPPGKIKTAEPTPNELEELLDASIRVEREANYSQALRWYEPANPQLIHAHLSPAKIIGVFGGNRSGKSEFGAAEVAILATGIVPRGLGDQYPREKLRGDTTRGVRIRVACTDFVNGIEKIILPKFRDGDEHHGPWIPPTCLEGGAWDKAWREKTRTLTVKRDASWAANKRVTDWAHIEFMCLVPETLVLRPMGEWSSLHEIQEGMEVLTSVGPKTVARRYEYPQAPVWRIRCHGGYEVTATATHRHKLSDGTWKTTQDLRQGDCLATHSCRPPAYDAPADEWRLGWTAILIGDGCLRGRQASFTANPDSRVLVHAPPLPPGCRLHPQTNGREYRVTLIRARKWNPLVQSLKRDGLWGKKSGEKFIPGWVFRQPEECLEKFLWWLWLTDGTLYGEKKSTYVTTSWRLAQDVKHLLWRCAYRAGVTRRWIEGGWSGKGKWAYHVITSWRRGVRQPGQVWSITAQGESPVVCLEVPGPHEFIADGLVTGNSYDQETPRFSGTSRHLTWFDELPPYEIWKECQMRHIDAKGRSILTLTPPDTVGDVAWVFDDIYEPGQPIHPRYDPKRIQCFTIFTEHNRFLPQAEVERIRLQLTPEEQETRLHGAFRHLAGLVYPHFRASPAPDGTCHVVEPFDIPRDWPIVMAIDPHPRTPWAMIWAAVDEEGRLWVFDEQWGGGDDVGSYAKIIELHESTHPNKPALRLVDPAASAQNDAMRRGFSIRGELDRCGIRCREAKHDFAAGRAKLIECLRPGKHGPRLFILRSCTQVIYQLTHHIWAEYTGHAVGRDPKQLPQERNKHFPDLLRYLALEDLRVGLRLPGPLRYIPTGGYRPTMLHAPRYTIGTSPAHPDRTRR